MLGGERVDLGSVGHRVLRPGDERRAGALRDVARAHLVAESLDGRRGRTDPDEPGVGDGLGEVGALGEEPVPGVHGVGTGAARDVDELGDVQVRLGGTDPGERVGLVGERDVHGLTVRVGVHRHGGDPGVGAGADDADGDLAAVRDEHLGDAGGRGHGSR
ncbi:hypothetical protein GCM10025865_01960 [Paraoerskovia sediminicola]|uniref:Uncharacterized protein n=1 Tax=Paraoerskovia sediminicola TaxID=1138587 RepID=A0ABN6X814_9CELL|nr:hypothetical protein GCM10025865_01960 [Paraoerskovia sediminicola]